MERDECLPIAGAHTRYEFNPLWHSNPHYRFHATMPYSFSGGYPSHPHHRFHSTALYSSRGISEPSTLQALFFQKSLLRAGLINGLGLFCIRLYNLPIVLLSSVQLVIIQDGQRARYASNQWFVVASGNFSLIRVRPLWHR